MPRVLLLCRLEVASEEFRAHLCKKKECEALITEGSVPAAGRDEKLAPIEALGIVMIRHGEEFGDESVYGALYYA